MDGGTDGPGADVDGIDAEVAGLGLEADPVVADFIVEVAALGAQVGRVEVGQVEGEGGWTGERGWIDDAQHIGTKQDARLKRIQDAGVGPRGAALFDTALSAIGCGTGQKLLERIAPPVRSVTALHVRSPRRGGTGCGATRRPYCRRPGRSDVRDSSASEGGGTGICPRAVAHDGAGSTWERRSCRETEPGARPEGHCPRKAPGAPGSAFSSVRVSRMVGLPMKPGIPALNMFACSVVIGLSQYINLLLAKFFVVNSMYVNKAAP